MRMRLINVIRGFFFVALLCVLGCGKEAGTSDAANRLIVALKPDKNPDAMLEDKELLEAHLSRGMGVETEVVIPMSGAVIEQGLANGTIDLAYISSTSAARFERKGYGEVLLAVEIDGKRSYSSYWVTLKENGYNSVEELSGRAVCFASPTSTSGYIIPTYDLSLRGLVTHEGGLEGFFGKGNVQFGTGYVSAIEKVLNGQVEAASVSDYVIEGDKHLSNDQKAALRIIQSQGPVPTHVLFLRKGYEAKVDLASVFENLSGEGAELRDRIFGAKLVSVDSEEHLSTIKAALAFVEEL